MSREHKIPLASHSQICTLVCSMGARISLANDLRGKLNVKPFTNRLSLSLSRKPDTFFRPNFARSAPELQSIIAAKKEAAFWGNLSERRVRHFILRHWSKQASTPASKRVISRIFREWRSVSRSEREKRAGEGTEEIIAVTKGRNRGE